MTQSSGTQPKLAESLAADIRAVASRLRRRLREHSDRTDLLPSQTAVLLRLESGGPATIATLARLEGMRHQSMRTVVGPLLEARLLRSAPDPSDKRQMLLSLTPKCVKALEKGRAARQDWLTRNISDSLTGEEQEQLCSAVELLARIVRD